MFRPEARKSSLGRAFAMAEITFHATVRHIRKRHGNAVLGLLMTIAQSVVMVMIFYLLFTLLNMRRTAIRGDFMLYVMSGVFMFMTHTKTMAAVIGSEGPTSAMMKHSPMNTIIAIAAAAFGTLYNQVLSAAVILYIYHVFFNPISLEYPVGSFMMLLLSWSTGIAIGMVFKAARPWQPEAIGLISTVYMRANMVASGKMFVANTLPAKMRNFFDWNPLYHTIDQARGFIFLNYNPHYSSISYPVYVMLGCMMIGLMAEFYTRKHASLSWGARR